MSKILVCLSNAIWHENEYKSICFYEGFLNALKNQGNNVLVFIPYDFNTGAFRSDNTLKDDINEEILRQDIISFDPDLIISFNYAVYNKLIEITDCPFVIWNADLVNLWNQVDVIRKNVERFMFFCFGKPSISDMQNNFPGVSSKQIHVVQAATGVVAENVVQDKNISFIGTNFHLSPHIHDFLTSLSFEQKNIFSKILEEAKIMLHDKNYIKSNDPDQEDLKAIITSQEIDITHCIAAEKRIREIAALSDLGLTLYGTQWNQAGYLFPSLVALFDDRVIYSIAHNQDIYNSSKICLNSMHPQCTNDLSWRVPDIMASNGCLFSEQSKSVQELYGNFPIPMYTNPYEARQLCIKLLKEDNLRADIVAKSQEIIATNMTWKKRLAEIQDITSINLFTNNEGSLKKLQPHTPKMKKILNLQTRAEYKLHRISYFTKELMSEIFFIPNIKRLFNKNK